MLDAEEFAELRMLQAKAFGRDDELSQAEAARLRELEYWQAPVAEPVPGHSTGSGSGLAGIPAGPGSSLRFWPAVVAVILTFALGVWLGWMLFGRADTSSIGLTQEQRARGAELVADGDYDANSLRAMIERDGVLVWLATKDAGGMLCLIVDDGSDATTACSDEDRVAGDGLVVVHETERDGGTDIAYATLLLTPAREPAVHLDLQRTDG